MNLNPRWAMVNGIMQCPMPLICVRHLMRLALDTQHRLDRPLDILEVGSLFGESAVVLALFGHVTCVDLFAHGLEKFHSQTSGLDIGALQGNSTEVLPTLPDRSFDLIFIDGDHTWPVVDEDLRQAQRLVRVGGVICGDDLERVLTTEEEHARMLGLRHLDYINDDNYHPGVSCAVYQNFGTDVNMRDKFWWVNR